jgi:type I restriction enzyme S subunit
MATEWREYSLGQLCEMRAGSVFPLALQGKRSGKFPFAKVSDMNLAANAVYIKEANNWIDEDDLINAKAKPFPEGTTAFAKIGEALKQNRLRYLVRPTVIDNNMMGAVPNSAVIDSKFFFYALSQFNFAEVAGGTALPYLTLATLYRLAMSVPPLREQRAIARVLSSLDDKIELHHRMNKTLEAMARALFKSWFVDFDPVRAKAECRDPGLAKPIADLFPNRLVDSELGEIPEGWSTGRLDDVIVFQRGFDLPSSSRSDGPYPVLAASGPSGFHNEFMACGPGVTTGRSGVLGNVFFVHDNFWPLNTSLWVKEFRRATPAYAFYLLRCLDLGIFNAGSAVPTLNRNHIHNLPALLAPSVLVEAFDRAVVPMLRRQRCADEESTRLRGIRDTLLPKLISGELRIGGIGALIDGKT